MWLPEVRAKLVRHRGGDAQHCFLLLNPGDVLFGFWAPFGAMSSSMIPPVKVRISWIVVREFRRSSSSSPSPGCKSSSCAWSMLTVKIRQPSHEFTFGVGISFIPYLLVLTPVV
jgi:3-dehydroquinate dehydratase